MRNRKTIYFWCTSSLCVLALSLISCDEEHIKDYYIENNCDSEILVKFNIGKEINSLQIEPGKTELIYSNSYVFGTVGVSDDRYHDNLSDLSVKKDTTNRLLHESLWEYERLGKYHARYILSIDNSLFEP